MPEKALQSWIHTQLFEQVPCNIAVIDRKYTIVEHNQNFQNLFGPGHGRLCYQVYKKRNYPCEHCMAAQTFSDGKIRVNDEVGLDLNGYPAFYLVHFAPIISEDGDIPYIIEMSTDITETKRLRSEYQTLFERVPCYIAVLNRGFRIVRANHRLQNTFGATTGQHCWEVYKRRAEKCENCPAELSFMDGNTHSSEQVGISKEGEPTHYVVTTTPLSKSDPVAHVIEMAVDVTRLHQLEQEKIDAERLAAVGQTVAGLAHGIKNILTGLEGGIYIFKTGLDRSDRSRIDQGWSILDRNIEKISCLTKNLLGFSKGHTPNVKMLKPQKVVWEVVELYREAASQHGIKIFADVDDNIAPAPFDAEGLHSCLANLVSNAIDACQMSDSPGCSVTVHLKEEADNISFIVEDEGCGMDYDIRQKVFTNFFTTKGRDGTGLGLLLTRKIVQEHGGRISLESRPGEGSMFKLIFPRNRLPRPEAGTGKEDSEVSRDAGQVGNQ